MNARIAPRRTARMKSFHSAVTRLLPAMTFLLAACNAFATERWVENGPALYSAPGSNCTVAGYSTIGAALNAAVSGDTIKVCPGVYTENLFITVPNLRIVSTNGPYASIVKSAIPNRAVFHIRAASVTVNGFGIRPAGTNEADNGIFVQVDGPTLATLQNNVVTGGRGGINLGCDSSQSTVVGNLLTGQAHAGIHLDTCEIAAAPGTHHNSVHRNVACGTTLIASIAFGGTASNNQVHDNVVTNIKIFGNNNVVQNNVTQLPISNMGTGTVPIPNLLDGGACT